MDGEAVDVAFAENVPLVFVVEFTGNGGGARGLKRLGLRARVGFGIGCPAGFGPFGDCLGGPVFCDDAIVVPVLLW